MNTFKMEMEGKINELVNEELQNAQQKFAQMHSAHEAYAVIKEEIDELNQENETLNDLIDNFWCYTKDNNKDKQLVYAVKICNYAINSALESIQVAAMASRFLSDLGDV